ncbi:MAG: hypothetical protein A2234_11275 [Elusimicrobia bacterium RIFOXYA2_FULL_58_8]|nr:MAG: hypothetical protein A2285_08525 [Elusimicrobia bacterium RIFOXYA12_FULL_57_11]OGS14521.1 MAG: hypothetical protein A2234_11275 [Elusimicrobia bacterium RIFOXYA2_FULL_58_8]
MINKNKVIIALVVLMSAMLVMRWSGKKRAWQEQRAAANVLPGVAEVVNRADGIGVPLPKAADNFQTIVEGPSAAQMPPRPASLKTMAEAPEPDPEITGPTKLPKDKCLALYKKHPRSVAFYAMRLGTPEVFNYAVCHAIADADESYCGFTGDESCRRSVLNYKMLYSAAKGQIDMRSCSSFFAISGAGPKDMPVEKLCGIVGKVLSGQMAPPEQFAGNLRFMSGDQASCSGLSSYPKKDCTLLADMMAGIKKGASRMWLYDALTGKGCAKADGDLVSLYCSNGLNPGERKPVKRDAAAPGPGGKGFLVPPKSQPSGE